MAFKRATKESVKRRRIIVSLQGSEKTGKTWFSLTAPDPIVYFTSDLGEEGVLEKFLDDKVIYREELKIAREIINDSDKGPAIDAEAEFDKFLVKYYEAYADNSVRTVVLDTATETWELLRLAMFGRLDQVPPLKYGHANEKYRRLIRAAYDSHKNLILIHRVKDEWVGHIDAKGRDVSVRTGKKLRAGFNDTGFLVQANIETFYDRQEKEFGIHIIDARQNMGIADEELRGPLCSFPFLASMIFPDTSPDEWGG